MRDELKKLAESVKRTDRIYYNDCIIISECGTITEVKAKIYEIDEIITGQGEMRNDYLRSKQGI